MPPKTKSSKKTVAESSKIRDLTADLLSWFAQNARDLPWRRTHDPYGIWVSEIMLQQTQVKTVIPYWERWMRELPTIASLANAPSEKIHKLWEGLGYYTRVRNMQKAAQQIVKNHGGIFPTNFDAVLALPGIGPYTAGAISSIAFNQPAPILDGNVIRVLTRVFGISENPREKKTNEKLWSLARQLVEQSQTAKDQAASCSHLNQSLMELGALVCTPRQPTCLLCPVRAICVAHRDNRVAELPNLEKRAAPTQRHFIAFVVEQNGKFLIRQRPAGVVNAHLWEFPNVEITAAKEPVIIACRPFKISGPPFCRVKHSITRYRILLEAYRAAIDKKVKGPEGSWLRLEEIEKLPLTSAHKKVLRSMC